MEITYLQYHGNDLEDKFICENFDLPSKGVFVDVGAGPNGVQGSNTYFFEKNGWEGVVIDGDPRAYAEMVKNRKTVEEAVISSKEKETVYYMNEKTSDVSGLYNTKQNSDRTIHVKTVTLESILEKHTIGEIDLLSIDTEGSEKDVWDSFDYKVHKPRLVLVEFITQGVANTSIVPYIRECGYRLVARLGPNVLFEYDINHH